MRTINILFPVLNEEKRLKRGIETTIAYLKNLPSELNHWQYILTIVDNGSTDETMAIAKALVAEHSCVSYLRIETRGVGAAFRAGFKDNTSEIIGYMDVDLSTDISHLETVLRLFEQSNSLKLVNGSRLSKNSNMMGRKWYRDLSSKGLVYLLKFFLDLKASDAICGFKFFKAEDLRLLMTASSDENGWFYIIELLLRAERNHYHIEELPVRWEDDYQTTVHYFKLIRNYLKHIFRLYITFRFKEKRS